MPDTENLALPLLEPAQAQKHVTVNEALVRIDGLAQLTLVSISQTIPPSNPAEGAVYGVPEGAVNAWAGMAGNVALVVGGGWVFVPAHRGWRALVLDVGEAAVFDGTGWRAGAITLSPGGASGALRVMETDVTLTTGGAMTAPLAFPARSIAFGVTGRVIEAITGSATAWEIGVDGDTARYGAGLGLAQNAWLDGPGTPMTLWQDTPLLITPTGGTFAGGIIRLAIHFAQLAPPDAVPG